ncbi:hypothetical protein K4749_19515 [Streptomyces sp. TRM72054]|uniref:WXG100 family type VII secretion target n=1 Tax=Streptomyces sp. TRM72054 TaxID=2870562 RepID=UPI001C8C4ED5|nr:hypothetical protein [Streptomyces sp. TRM72054]MBX9395727.1 hypothetical protein [Streptomyces sp. TRM72054]
MSGDKDKKQPNLHEAEHQEAAQQNGTLDAVMNVTKVINPWGPDRGFHFGKTSFEGYDLNQMIDIVESASPELVEAAGNALVDARNAINEAADELSLNLNDVDWEGEAHTAFSTWGNDLVTTARALATYADTVGTQVMAASSGLASVRKSMPPRDTRSDPKTVDDIPEAKRVESNDEYTAALTAEKHRQEAINQMYRLASFYTVSSGTMQAAEEPVFPKMPDVGVPEPPPGWQRPIERTGQGSLSTVADSGTTRHDSVDSGATRARFEDVSTSHQSVDGSVRSPERHVGTEIDSVGTLPPQETLKPTPVASPSTQGPGVTSVGTPPPIAPVATPPVSRGPVGRTPGISGVPATKTPASAQGRVGGTPPGTPAGRTGTGPMGPVGRAATSGQAGSRTTGPMGRGVIGGMPRTTGPAAGQASGVPRVPVTGMGATNPGRTVTGRANVGRTTDGVVGGRPVPGTTPGTSGSRVPRGTVIGGQNVPTSRGTGEKPGQRGVIGAPGSTTGAGKTPRRSVGRPDGVVGAPKGRPSGSRNNGDTPSGNGVMRGLAGNQGSGEMRSRRDDRRDGASSTD